VGCRSQQNRRARWGGSIAAGVDGPFTRQSYSLGVNDDTCSRLAKRSRSRNPRLQPLKMTSNATSSRYQAVTEPRVASIGP